MTDMITMQVIRYALEQIADEMGYTLVRTGRSTLITEIKDISCVVTDATGQTIAQAHHNPSMLAGFEITMRELVARYGPENLSPGDVIVTNDPYKGGQHVMDLYAISPAYHDGALIGFVGNIVHHTDLGGVAPGGVAGGVRGEGGRRRRGDFRHHRQPDPGPGKDLRRYPRADQRPHGGQRPARCAVRPLRRGCHRPGLRRSARLFRTPHARRACGAARRRLSRRGFHRR